MPEQPGINPSRLAYGDNWPTQPAVPDQFSSANWTLDSTQDPLNPLGPRKDVRPFIQQTFLGCTVTTFNVNGAFGDSSSSLNVSLVQDEYNTSDGFPLGVGDDQYHNGQFDFFRAPPVGSPVFFKFGANHATVPQAWLKTFDEIYKYKTLTPPIRTPFARNRLTSIQEGVEFVDVNLSNIPGERDYLIWNYGDLRDVNNKNRGAEHFCFGGILQNYSQESSTGGDPRYSVSVVDPREILSNVTLILNNYSNSIFNLPNIFNIFGFLEYSPSLTLKESLNSYYTLFSFKKFFNTDGSSEYLGEFNKALLQFESVSPQNREVAKPFSDCYVEKPYLDYLNSDRSRPPRERVPEVGRFPLAFPNTGINLARRTDRGIPLHRVIHALNAMMDFYGELPEEYSKKNFGSVINFRGFNYIVDFSGLPLEKVPNSYCLDFEQMNILEFCQEICDITSHDFYVSLLPVIDHPAVSIIHKKNTKKIKEGKTDEVIVGIIRIDVIDRSKKPKYGAISNYINTLKTLGSEIVSSKEGFELSNITTDKFIVGAQEVDMYFFTNNGDRDTLQVKKEKTGEVNKLKEQQIEQWFLTNSLRQQILPFYGFLGKDCVTIPRGYGPYQQILLDSSNLNANGVGFNYIATEMELRAAAISYESWRDFLMQYNDLYLESVEEDDSSQAAFLNVASIDPALAATVSTFTLSKKYGVTVPRCVFYSDYGSIDENNIPISPCSPPYGWPLYYKRATAIGMPETGLVGFSAATTSVLSNLQRFRNKDDQNSQAIVNSSWLKILKDSENIGASPEEKAIIDFLKEELKKDPKADIITLLEDRVKKDEVIYQDVSKTALEQMENVMKVYEFVKAVSSNLGTKFLVKIPKETNPFYSKRLTFKDPIPASGFVIAGRQYVHEIEMGPFGFKPRVISDDFTYTASDTFKQSIKEARDYITNTRLNKFNLLLGYGTKTTGLSSLNLAHNSITEALKPASGEQIIDFTYGALKSSFDNSSRSHVFNYEPEPQGGFFPFNLYSNIASLKDLNTTIKKDKLPFVIQSLLFPIDSTNFIDENNRISPYVRFDNSQYLDFASIPSQDFTQVIISEVGLMPDNTLDLENTRTDIFTSFSPDGETQKKIDKAPKSCAFVKCTLDSKFYMPPKMRTFYGPVYGRQVIDKGKIRSSKKTWDKITGKERITLPVYEPNFVPFDDTITIETTQEDFLRNILYSDGTRDTNGVTNVDSRKQKIADVVNTTQEEQDENHVYALITLPGPIRSRIDQRFVNGMFQINEGTTIQHILSQDVVKGMPGFEEPNYKTTANKKLQEVSEDMINLQSDLYNIPQGYSSDATVAYKKALIGLQYSMDNMINISMPSPVYPDLVALSLMSKERCYGPWISSYSKKESIAYKNIPGKVEFIKDENLSPWVYNGYDLMNDAGSLQAEFSNSLLLYSENGNISFVGLPKGNSLLNPLVEGGPLVTNIDISVDSSNGVTTSYSMSTYTPRFGNLQRQKADLIAKVSRDRQRVNDEKNSLVRKGLNKSRKVKYDNTNNTYKNINSLSTFTENLRVHAEQQQREYEVTSVPISNNQEVLASNGASNTSLVHQETNSKTSISSESKKTGLASIDTRQQLNRNMSTARGLGMEGVSRDKNPFIPSSFPRRESPIEDIDDLLL